MPVLYNFTSTEISACIVQLYMYSPQICTVQLLYAPQYLYTRVIPLLPSVPLQYSYISTPLSACKIRL